MYSKLNAIKYLLNQIVHYLHENNIKRDQSRFEIHFHSFFLSTWYCLQTIFLFEAPPRSFSLVLSSLVFQFANYTEFWCEEKFAHTTYCLISMSEVIVWSKKKILKMYLRKYLLCTNIYMHRTHCRIKYSFCKISMHCCFGNLIVAVWYSTL